MSVARSRLSHGEKPSIRAAIAWGGVVGAVQATSPLGFWWLDPATVCAVGLAVIAAVLSASRWPMDGGESSPSSVLLRWHSW
jgi:divalent metal cation (Fe/Co/Zn/Cd) transporter